MPLPSSGTITLADLQAEFGGSNPASLSEYYADNSYVASGTEGSGGAVPSSGTISLSDFYGVPTKYLEDQFTDVNTAITNHTPNYD